VALPEQRVLLKVSWQTYERVLAEHVDSPGTRLAHSGGLLEITAVSVGHEGPNRTLALFVEIVAEETNRDLHPAGSTTFKREDLGEGVRAGFVLYLDERAERVRGKTELDFRPAPLTSGSSSYRRKSPHDSPSILAAISPRPGRRMEAGLPSPRAETAPTTCT